MPCSKWIVAVVATALLGTTLPTAGVHAQSAPKAAKLSTDALVDYFEAVAFGARTNPRATNQIIVKWMDPTINLALEEPHAKIDPAMAGKLVAMVKAHAATLGKLTGRKFAGARDAAAADIRIFFVRRADMGKIYGPDVDPKAVAAGAAAGECYSIRWRKTPTSIFKVIVVVNVERDPALTNSCLLKELTQSMGLPHDSDAMRPSIFSKGDRLTALAPQDEILVRTLYDPRMQAGLPRPEALKRARTVIAELLKAAR